mgnify:CR=1|jgi:hypothetical protein
MLYLKVLGPLETPQDILQAFLRFEIYLFQLVFIQLAASLSLVSFELI